MNTQFSVEAFLDQCCDSYFDDFDDEEPECLPDFLEETSFYAPAAAKAEESIRV